MFLSLLAGAHLVAGAAALATVVGALVIAAPAAVRGDQPPGLYRPLQRGAAALVGMAVLLGAALYLASHRPASSLHYVYAAAALLVMPVAGGLGRRDPGRARYYQLGGTLLLAGVIFRLVTTG